MGIHLPNWGIKWIQNQLGQILDPLLRSRKTNPQFQNLTFFSVYDTLCQNYSNFTKEVE